jgi:hypothetical protein
MSLQQELDACFVMHRDTRSLRHGVKLQPGQEFQPFRPSEFVYAFFCFNSVYKIDWALSFANGRSTHWNGQYETEQIRNYIRAMDSELNPNTCAVFQSVLLQELKRHGVDNPQAALQLAGMVNQQRLQVGQFVRLYEGTVAPADFVATVSAVVLFVYGVRCNLFHGTKRLSDLQNPEQEERLSVYAAILTATTGLLFEAAKNHNWMP